jgi:membrane protein
MLLIIVVSTLFLDSAAASNQIRDFLAFFFPGDTANVLQDAVTAAAEQRGSASIFAIIVLAWSSANLFGNLEKVLSNVFGLPRRRKIYERRLIGAVMITVLGIFLLASLLTNLIFSLLGLVFFNQFSTWLTLASFLVPVAFNAAIFAMLYGFITASHLRWDAILSASLIGGIAFEFAKMGFVWYLSSLTNFTFIYGSVTTVVVFMLWAFLTFCLVLIFAEIARILDEWIGQTSAEALETDAPQIMIEDHEPRHLLPPPE